MVIKNYELEKQSLQPFYNLLRPVIIKKGEIPPNRDVNGRREFFIRFQNGNSQTFGTLGIFASFDLRMVRVTELDGFSGKQKKDQIQMLISSGHTILKTDNPERFIAYKKREMWE